MAEKIEPPPWYRWQWAAFLKSTRGWTFDQRCLYRELLDIQWQEGFIPKSAAACIELVGCTQAQWDAASPTVLKKFPMNGIGRANPKMAMDRRQVIGQRGEFSEFGKKGAEIRWGKSGDPEPIQTDAIGGHSHPIGSDSREKRLEVRVQSKDSSQRSLTTHVAEATLVVPAGLNLGAWEEWVSHRKAIKKPIRAHQEPKAMQAMAKLGDQAAQQAAVDHSIANGWQGLFEQTTRSGAVKKPFRVPKSIEELEAEEAARNAKH